jgi:hypothetical protein
VKLRGLSLLLLAYPLFADPLAETQARFGVITGDVGLLSQGAAEWIAPHEGLPIETGDQIRTGEDGRVEILLSENAAWRLEPETILATESMSTHAGRFSLSSGTLLGTVDSARVAGIVQRWEFNTPAALVSVHGTQFAITVSKPQGTSLGVFEGMVELAPAETAEGLQPPVQVSQGHVATLKRGQVVRTVNGLTPEMQRLKLPMSAFRRRQIQIENTWSPFTTTVRADLRKKFVAPPQKTQRAKPRPKPIRRAKQTANLEAKF